MYLHNISRHGTSIVEIYCRAQGNNPDKISENNKSLPKPIFLFYTLDFSTISASILMPKKKQKKKKPNRSSEEIILKNCIFVAYIVSEIFLKN